MLLWDFSAAANRECSVVQRPPPACQTRIGRRAIPAKPQEMRKNSRSREPGMPNGAATTTGLSGSHWLPVHTGRV